MDGIILTREKVESSLGPVMNSDTSNISLMASAQDRGNEGGGANHKGKGVASTDTRQKLRKKGRENFEMGGVITIILLERDDVKHGRVGPVLLYRKGGETDEIL